MRRDEFSVLDADDIDEGIDQDIVDMPREIKADDERDEKRRDGLDQPRAQLDQMIHQRGLGRLDLGFAIVLRRDSGHCAASVLTCEGAAAASWP